MTALHRLLHSRLYLFVHTLSGANSELSNHLQVKLPLNVPSTKKSQRRRSSQFTTCLLASPVVEGGGSLSRPISTSTRRTARWRTKERSEVEYDCHVSMPDSSCRKTCSWRDVTRCVSARPNALEGHLSHPFRLFNTTLTFSFSSKARNFEMHATSAHVTRS